MTPLLFVFLCFFSAAFYIDDWPGNACARLLARVGFAVFPTVFVAVIMAVL